MSLDTFSGWKNPFKSINLANFEFGKNYFCPSKGRRPLRTEIWNSTKKTYKENTRKEKKRKEKKRKEKKRKEKKSVSVLFEAAFNLIYSYSR